jgi:inorganic pyrophosphatase
MGEDHDPWDFIPLKVIGVMQMVNRGEADDKIIAVCRARSKHESY